MAHFAAGAPLTAGQMNDVAHSGIQLIEEQVLTSDAASVTFSSIPQNFQTLWLVMSAGCDSASGVVVIAARFNGDTGSNYITQRIQHLGDATDARDYNASATEMQIGIANGSRGLQAQNSIIMPGYSRTDREKSLISTFANPGSPSDVSSMGFCGGLWHSTSAITDMEIKELDANGIDPIVTGSIFSLYGLGDTSA